MTGFNGYKRLVAVLGILVVMGPVLWLCAWLTREDDPGLATAASWIIGNVDVRVARAAALLDDLVERDVDVEGCGTSQIELLRRSLSTAGAVKELSLVDIDGQTLCSDRGRRVASLELVSFTPTTHPNILLDVVRLGANGERMLRVRRLMAPSGASLAAILPPEVLLPQLAPDGTAFNGHASLALADGTVIGSVGPDMDTLSMGRVRSNRLGIVATVASTGGSVLAIKGDWRRAAVLVTAPLALGIIGAGLVLLWRERRGPFHEIERAIGAGEFVPYYQPIVDIKSGAIVGAEVLVRWRKRDGSLVTPATFIPFLETTDLILDMTRSIMRQVSEDTGFLLEHRPSMYVAFNIAPRHLSGDQLVDDIGSIFVGGPISMSQIVLEITERHEIENLAETRDLIAALQGLGCRVAIDDVGTGRNGLSYILKLGVDIIKIDKMFVDAIRTEPHSQAIVDTLVDLARNLRMQIVAEGVENFEQVTYLREHGISSAQGFVFAPPLPGPAFVQLIEAIDPPMPRAPRAIITGEAPRPAGLSDRAPSHAAA